MGGYIQNFRDRIDEPSIRGCFPEMTDSETPVWKGGPSTLSMAERYLLALLVLSIHFIFYVGSTGDSIEQVSRMEDLMAISGWLTRTTGVMGFAAIMLFVTKANHYANLSTSGRFTTGWLLANTILPVSWRILEVAEALGDEAGVVFRSPLEEWNHDWFLPLGVASFTVMVVFTRIYQRSFQYALTDRRIHIRKRFLYLDTSTHGIAFNKVENIKADPTILGRILGFGNVHIVTGSGVGLQTESSGLSLGVISEANKTARGSAGVISFLFGWIMKKRERTVMASDMGDCLYGIRDPLGVYRLINELIDHDHMS